MARCGCGSSCTCLFESSDSLIITGNGDRSNGYQGEIRIDPASPAAITISAAGLSVATGGGGGGISDGDKGDIIVSGTGTILTIDTDAVTYAKMQNVSATDKILGRSSSGSGNVEEITCTATGRSILDDTSVSAVRTTLGLVINTDVQAYNADLAAIAGLSPANDDFIQRKAGVWTNRTPVQVGVDLALVAESITNGVVGIAPSQNVVYDALALKQDLDAELTAIAGLTSAADTVPYFTGSGTAAVTSLTAAARAVLDDATTGDMLTTLGAQPVDAELTAIAGVTSAADKVPYFTGSGTAAVTDLTSAARTLLDDVSISAMRTTLGLAIGTDVQAYDATTSALAAYNTNGILTQTAADTFVGRIISTGDATQITVTNGDGVSGNPTLSLPASVKITTALIDTNANETIKFGATASAVNEVTVTNAATTGSPVISASGGDTNVSLTLDAKGTGVIKATQALVVTPVTLTDAATIATDASLSNHFRVVLGGNRILGNPTNPTDGQKVVWEIIQDNTGSRTLSYGGHFALGSDIVVIFLSTTPNKRDFIGATYNATETKWYITAVVRGY
jgi:hypothetical protein